METSKELPEGFQIIRGACLAPGTFEELIAALPLEQTKIKLFGREHNTPRLTAWMGEGSYTYSGIAHAPAPAPTWVAQVQAAAEYACSDLGIGASEDSSGVASSASSASTRAAAKFNSVLTNVYRDGRDSVAYHADDEPELGPEPVIASVSFGASRTFLIKEKSTGKSAEGARVTAKTWRTELHHGDLVIMSGNAQRDFLHSVPKTSRPVGPRLNLTFRVLRTDRVLCPPAHEAA